MANLSVVEPDALMYARPDLWESWGVIPWATRLEATMGFFATGIGPTPRSRFGRGSPFKAPFISELGR